MITTATKQLLKIGEVATSSGLPVKTIRYYEEIGLLTPTVERSQAGYRLFNTEVLNRLAFVKRAQSLGLALNEIRTILTVHDEGELPCYEVKQHLEDKVAIVSQQIQALETLRAELNGILSGWQEHPPAHVIEQTICPNLQ
ncbi:heavy metal-responsive transcriptional regulator [Leptolyngbya sp. FACHB-321]|uniref:heavy metal-responsive transcriptional regulator n=1 Tax=Leptolyngbya sp. FACHB-321 TaxID=2692807 RepID=UPI00168367BB|nr:heavy metal-responsive transcriptional regulator [Leptolyngbya sp. FACHB-321]MBD2038018.1 heavy metal-responsive transcriptional regulator [Leptolyngbya sp. FACHB-321]